MKFTHELILNLLHIFYNIDFHRHMLVEAWGNSFHVYNLTINVLFFSAGITALLVTMERIFNALGIYTHLSDLIFWIADQIFWVFDLKFIDFISQCGLYAGNFCLHQQNKRRYLLGFIIALIKINWAILTANNKNLLKNKNIEFHYNTSFVEDIVLISSLFLQKL